ncbi:hypothetical protein TCAL_08062 [Tigriopus californicus]|uniref:C-type lectin domain-containing protein n=1 Tax=Tigriopus californicus TaxID=6832 RepID=A0A553NQ33_TIGCA|nr:hypothetical protein TCAL_08062 [Tigriopus californicus]
MFPQRAQRSENNALIETSESMSLANASIHCGDTLKGGLLKTLDISLLEAFKSRLTTFPLNLWMGLEKTISTACTGAACVNNSQVFLEDGSMLLAIPPDIDLNLAATSSCVKMTIANGDPKFAVTSEPCSNNLRVVCEISCKATDYGKCPSTHPFAIENGQRCCPDFRKIFQRDLDPECDGSKISRTATEACCPDSIPCPDGINCQDGPRSGHFCPTMPNLARSGDFAFPRSTNRLNSEMSKEFCWNTYNSSLAMLKSMWDVEAILRGMTEVTTETHSNNAFFRGKLCNNKMDCLHPTFGLQWADGSPMKDLPFKTIVVGSTSHTILVARINKINGEVNLNGDFSTATKEVTCQKHCSFNMAYCPRDHPFATQSGQSCSKHYTRSHNKSVNLLCDGSNLAFEDPPECCQICVSCPKINAKCQDSPNAPEYCPPNPVAIRMGDTGLIAYSNMSLNPVDNLQFCRESHNARMISSIDMSVIQRVKFQTEFKWFYLGIENPYMAACKNDDCLNNEYVIWHNGSMLTSREGITIDLFTYNRACPYATAVNTIGGGLCSTAVTPVCETSCRGSDPKYCPSDRPFAANNGHSCCADFNKKFDLATDPTCDGTTLTFSDSEMCCVDPIPCADPVNGCLNSQNARTFCPAFPSLRRSRDMAIAWNSTTTMYHLQAREYCSDVWNGALPTFKSFFDIEYVQQFSSTKRFFVNAWFSRGTACSGDNCFIAPNNITWGDGSQLKKYFSDTFHIVSSSHNHLTVYLTTTKNIVHYYGGGKLEKFDAACQIPCSKVTPKCPSDYPLATGLGGAMCSRNPWKLNDPNVNPACDGSKLAPDDPVECCQDCINCLGNFTKCQNSQAIEWFCFGHPNASRYGPTGFNYLSSSGQLNRRQAGEACHAAGGRLPNLNAAAKMEGLENFLYSKGLSVTVWTGLESSFAESCSNEQCINSTILEWSDGSKVVDTEPIKISINTHRCVSFVQSTTSLQAVDCSNQYDVVCEVDCDPQTTPCPMDHPFPIKGGKFCCNDYNKKFDSAANDLCDGTSFTDDDPEECCPDPLPCSKHQCTLNTLNKEFCPKYPERTRFGNAAFQAIGLFNWIDSIAECQSQFNASSLSLDHPMAISYLLNEPQLRAVEVWTSYQYENGRKDICGPHDCFDQERRFVWGNGRPFFRFPRFNLYIDVTSDEPLYVKTSIHLMNQKAEANRLDTVCQLECSISPALCPSDHPFATARGQQCSKYYERKDSAVSVCDGGFLLKTDPIECCIDCVPCPITDRPCIDAVKAHGAGSRFWLGGIASYEAIGRTVCEPPNECQWLDGSDVDLSFFTLFDVVAGYKTLSFYSIPKVELTYIVKQIYVPTETLCQASCSFYQDRLLCPTTHPFAFESGQKCCAHFTQSTANGCAGNLLDFQDPIECCSNSTPCSDLVQGCKTHPSQALLCPPYSGALRMNERAFQIIAGPSQTYDEAKATCQALGGFLPIVKTMQDFENHVFTHWLNEVPATRYWTSLKHGAGSQYCINAACNAQVLHWADDSRFVYEDLDKPITGRTTETCYAIDPQSSLPLRGNLVGVDCSTKWRVVCEFSCF